MEIKGLKIPRYAYSLIGQPIITIYDSNNEFVKEYKFTALPVPEPNQLTKAIVTPKETCLKCRNV